MIQGNTVYVRWYRDILLQGEVVENDRKDQLAGMVAVRISVQGVRITALFHPQHVYQSEDEAKGNSPTISPNPPKVATEAREISRTVPEVSIEDVIKCQREMQKNVSVAGFVQKSINIQVIENFKAANWDNERNHLHINALDEFYRLWLQAHDKRSVTLPSHTPKPLPSAKPKQKMRCWHCEYLDNDLISGSHESVSDGCHFCGLHGRARVYPDGLQQNLNNKGGCGYVQRKNPVQLDLFS